MADLAPDRPLERQEQRWRQALRARSTQPSTAGTGSNVKTVSMSHTAPKNSPFMVGHCVSAVPFERRDLHRRVVKTSHDLTGLGP